MLERSSERTLLAEITKFNANFFAAVAPLTGIDSVVTDKLIDPEFAKALMDHGIQYLHAA